MPLPLRHLVTMTTRAYSHGVSSIGGVFRRSTMLDQLGVAFAYAATTNSVRDGCLDWSLAKEWEVYSVGVLCLRPGAVGDRSSVPRRSGSAPSHRLEHSILYIYIFVKSCEVGVDQGVRGVALA